MNTVVELEQAIERLPRHDFEILAAWVEQRFRSLRTPSSSISGATEQTLSARDHSAFLRSYAPEDEGLYDDAATR